MYNIPITGNTRIWSCKIIVNHKLLPSTVPEILSCISIDPPLNRHHISVNMLIDSLKHV